MTRPRGRPLQPRSDTERLDYLEKLLGFGRNRGEIDVGYVGSDVVLWSGPEGDGHPEIASGVDLRTAIDRAISRKGKA